VAHIVNQLLNNQNLSPSSSVESAFSSGTTTISLEEMMNTGNSSGLTQTAIDAIVEGLPAANTVISAYQDVQYTNNELGSFLQATERMNLLKSLDAFLIPPEVNRQIASGDISSHALLTLIQEKMGSVPEASIKNLFASKEYQSLIKEELSAKWTFKPDSLTKENIIERHFESLSHELSDFMSYMEKASGSTSETVSQQANHLQENINFMKTINDLFTYVQLPLKLHNQNAHGELYVYTKKKEGRTAKDGISVLLHLDMDHLGPIDIHIDLHHNNVVGKFYLSNEDTIELISTNLPVLEEALLKKGYSLNAEILERKKEVDIVEDFINPDFSSQSVTRYNFDIRA
jgi:flagellar hook-length control protein FliK